MPRAYRKRVNPDLYRSIAALHLRKDSLKPPTMQWCSRVFVGAERL
jgi:hypothetical protein